MSRLLEPRLRRTVIAVGIYSSIGLRRRMGGGESRGLKFKSIMGGREGGEGRRGGKERWRMLLYKSVARVCS